VGLSRRYVLRRNIRSMYRESLRFCPDLPGSASERANPPMSAPRSAFDRHCSRPVFEEVVPSFGPGDHHVTAVWLIQDEESAILGRHLSRHGIGERPGLDAALASCVGSIEQPHHQVGVGYTVRCMHRTKSKRSQTVNQEARIVESQKTRITINENDDATIV